MQRQKEFIERSHRQVVALTKNGGAIISKHSAKLGHRHCRADREARTYASGFKGEIEVGNINTAIIGVSMKAWYKKHP